MREDVTGTLRTALVFSIPAVYTSVVIFMALYLKVTFDVNGFITIASLLAPVVAVWFIVLYRRQKRSLEAQMKGFMVSPEKSARALRDFIDLVHDKNEPVTEPEDSSAQVSE